MADDCWPRTATEADFDGTALVAATLMAHIGRPFPWFQPTTTDNVWVGYKQTPLHCRFGYNGHYSTSDMSPFDTGFLRTGLDFTSGWIGWNGLFVTTFTFPFTFTANWRFEPSFAGNVLSFGFIDVFGNRLLGHHDVPHGSLPWNIGLSFLSVVFDLVEAPFNADGVLTIFPKPY